MEPPPKLPEEDTKPDRFLKSSGPCRVIMRDGKMLATPELIYVASPVASSVDSEIGRSVRRSRLHGSGPQA